MSVRGALLPGLALLVACPAMAQESGDAEFTVFNNAWTDPAECNPGNAMALSLDEARRRHRELDGRCVAVQGWWRDRAMFADAHSARARDAPFSDTARDVRIGLYGDWGKLGMPTRSPRRRTMVGKLADCDRWSSFSMVMGYCHYTGGPVIILSMIARR